ITEKLIDVRICSGPRTHQSINIRLDKFVKMPPLRIQILNDVLSQPDKNGIRLNRQNEVDLRNANAFRESSRHCVGVPCVSEPSLVREQRQPLRCQESRLRPQLAALFHSVLELARKFLFEKDHQLGAGRAVFRSAKTKSIDPDLPRNLLWQTSQRRDPVGES